MAKVFISYSRKDIEFAKRLTAELKKCELDFWIDWEGIPPTVDWWREIEKGIEEADVFLFLISPDSSASKVCGQEIDTAVKNAKRIIPLVVREVKSDEAPKQLSRLNWIFFRQSDDFDAAFQKLSTSIHTDYEWVQQHRWLQVRALDWQRDNKDNSSLLRGKDLQDVEFQLATNTSKGPHPTDLQREYVFESRKATDRQRRSTTSIAIGGVAVLAVLAVVAVFMAIRATQQSNISQAGELAALASTQREKQFDVSLLLSIEAFKKSNNIQTRNALMENVQTNPQLEYFMSGHDNSVTSLAISVDGHLLAAGSCKEKVASRYCLKGEITLWSLQNHKQIATLISDAGDVNSIAFGPDGKTLVSTSCAEAHSADPNTCIKGEIILWDVNSHERMGTPMKGHDGAIRRVAFSPDGKTLASGGEDWKIILWDLGKHEPRGDPLTGQNGMITDIAFSPNGKTLIAADLSITMMLWDISSLPAKGRPLDGHSGTVMSIAFSPDGSTLASGSADGTIVLWDIKNHQHSEPIDGPDEGVSYVAFIPDSNTLVAVGSKNTITLYEVADGHPYRTGDISGPGWEITSIASSTDENILVFGGVNNTLAVWDLETRLPLGKPLANTELAGYSVAFSPDGKFMASGTDGKSILLWDLSSNPPTSYVLNGQEDYALSLAFSPDGKMLASGGVNSDLILWDVARHQPIGDPLKRHLKAITSVAFSPDGKTLASASVDSTIILWNVETRQPLGTPLTVPDKWVKSVAFNPDGKTLAAGISNNMTGGEMILWDLTSRPPTSRSFQSQDGEVDSVAFNKDGLLASGSNGYFGSVLLWNLGSSQPRSDQLTSTGAGISNIAFSRDGNTLAVGIYDGSGTGITLWDVKSQRLLGKPFNVPNAMVSAVAFSPDGNTLASVSNHGTIFLWNINPQFWVEQSCQRAGRNFTQVEWTRYFPNDNYRKTCPQWD